MSEPFRIEIPDELYLLLITNAGWGHEMHDYLIRCLEVGERAAMGEDDEQCGYGALFDLHCGQYLEGHYEQ
jgi:hypothetical protein